MDISLDGSEYRAFMSALMAAYPVPDDLATMMRLELDKNLWATAPYGTSMRTIAFSVIRQAQAEGWTAKLLCAMFNDRRDNDKVRELAVRYGMGIVEEANLAYQAEPSPALQRMVARSSVFTEVASFIDRMAEIERQVCRIEVPISDGRLIKGTGFLVSPSMILTNYHVMAPVILGEQGKKTADGLAGKASDVIARFDYRRSKNGVEIDPGVPYRLTREWLVDSSPDSNVDTMLDANEESPAIDELDYALLNLENDTGRGWVSLPLDMPDIESDKSVLIVQHPFGSTLKLAVGTDAIIGLNENRTRLKYTTSTEEGSSGSPVFNINWELIALHHIGDPNYERPAQFNQGIPVTCIRQLMEKRGVFPQPD